VRQPPPKKTAYKILWKLAFGRHGCEALHIYPTGKYGKGRLRYETRTSAASRQCGALTPSKPTVRRQESRRSADVELNCLGVYAKLLLIPLGLTSILIGPGLLLAASAVYVFGRNRIRMSSVGFSSASGPG
jgi:hypothetical protein